MTDTPSIPPALTAAIPPEEWTAQLARTPEERRKHLLWARDEADADGYLTIHGLAALALYGQPFGFTHEDIAALEEAVSQMVSLEGDRSLGGAEGVQCEREQSAVRLVIAKITALLPPLMS
jgi:hypothetical protein